jgi:hypothetical protein
MKRSLIICLLVAGLAGALAGGGGVHGMLAAPYVRTLKGAGGRHILQSTRHKLAAPAV